MRSIIFAAAIIGATPVAARPAEDAAAARWLQATGRRLSSADPYPAELAPLVAKLAGARVVGLGEVTHGTHEDLLFKASLVRALVTAGAIDTLAIEANRTAGLLFDAYVRRGEGDPVALTNSPSVFRMLKNQEFASLLLWLRAWNLAHPQAQVGVTAIDDQDGAVDAAFALDVVARHDAALAGRLRAGFGAMLPPPGGARVRPSDWVAKHDAAEAQRLLAAAAALRDAFAAHRAEWSGDADYAEADYAARITWQNFHVFELDVAGADLAKTPPDYQSRRDRYLAANLIERLGTTRRAALWAHNWHVAHTFPADWLKQGYRSLGVELRQRLGGAYRTVAATYTRATALATSADGIGLPQLVAEAHDGPVPLDNSGPHGTGRTLARLPGDSWWFDPAAAGAGPAVRRWLAVPRWGGEIGWIVDPAKFQHGQLAENAMPFGMGYDAVVWFRTLTPQHRWPVATPLPKP